jgi:L-serine dehydratase
LILAIERNAAAPVNSVPAAGLALRGDGRHRVSLDAVIETIREAGADTSTKDTETAQGGGP